MMIHLLYENLLFFTLSTVFFVGVGWAWRHTKSYDLPKPLPSWFKVWFFTVQLGGSLPPLAALVWGIWQGNSTVIAVLGGYWAMVGLQILAESLALRQFHSTVFVMVPYLYLPYRIWQLYEGVVLSSTDELGWFRVLLIGEIVLWTVNYALDLAQLPRLLHWIQPDLSAATDLTS